MNINERFRIASDKNNYIVEELKSVLTPKKKDVPQVIDRYEWKEIAYCSTTDGVVKFLGDLINRECLSGAETLEEWHVTYTNAMCDLMENGIIHMTKEQRDNDK